MANGVDLVNMTQLSNDVSERLLTSISPLVTIFKAVGIALLIYVIFLLLKALFRWRTMSKIGKISKNVQQINDKLDVFIKRASIREREKIGKAEKKKKGKK